MFKKLKLRRLERKAKQETDQLFERVRSHWTWVGYYCTEEEFQEKYDFFLQSNRRKKGLA